MAITVRQMLKLAGEQLGNSSTPGLDAELLLSHVMNISRSGLLARLSDRLSEQAEQDFLALLARRRRGEPVAYLLGSKGFWTLDLQVTPDVLIPRPETELLVEICLSLLPTEQGDFQVADLGTGSGAIALALAVERPGWQLTATDFSPAALSLAAANAAKNKLNNVSFSCGTWCEALVPDKRYDAIVSNPPYIAPDDPHLLGDSLPFEPLSALTAPDCGLADIRQIVAQSADYLRSGGWLLLEHGHDQGPAVRTLLQTRDFQDIVTARDLAGLDRVTYGRRPTDE
ncbi:peptide chain release factor N(5)-glutamine methyltransferase [Pseudohongiella spirulinae]|uniref:Release factor glutamine methyltransferase n=1 Tax=Pseudohongiella spirulinae TaxID=1249552 RepID=A0A0S2KBR6_9GAMM|nr:peptide chain release factor N(5)-glutamine methyltransferase [Pseudohongiella spirulinae]ALO45439.1 N5-glutamine S-adenosyl-L-methionine-dependent methyltransferase [Pseudohongiella spirulinae]